VSSPALKVEAVSKSYRTGSLELKVLDGASLEVPAGGFISVQGESGCGKTTLLNILAGIEQPDSGEVSWSGESILKLRRDALARRRGSEIGIVFQSYYLIPELDSLQNALMSRRILNGGLSKDDRRDAESMLERVGLGDRGRQMPSTLSGGERQRVAIARALLAGQRVILADEPTGNLDERTGNQVMDLLEALCLERAAALVLVTHNKEHARRARCRFRLAAGELIEENE